MEMKQIIYAPIGAPKTQLLKKARSCITKSGGLNLLFIAPTLGMINRIKQELIKDNEIKGFIPHCLTSFDRIVSGILNKKGIEAKEIDDYTKHRIVDTTIKELKNNNKLKVLGEVSEFPGFINVLTYLIGEIKRSGIKPRVLLNKIEKLNAGAKVYEIALIYESYQAKLKQSGLYDPEEKYFKAVEILQDDVSYFDNIECVLIDEFTDFEPQHLTLLEVIGQNVKEIIVNIPYKKHTPFSSVAKTITQLKSMGYTVTTPKASKNYKNKGINLLAEGVFEDKQHIKIKHSDFVKVAKFPNRRMEVTHIVGEIKRLIIENNWEPGDVAVVVRDLDAYRELLYDAFEKSQLPLNLDLELPLTRVPVIIDVLNLLKLGINDYDRNSVIKYLTSPYFVKHDKHTRSFLLKQLLNSRRLKHFHKIHPFKDVLQTLGLPKKGEFQHFAEVTKHIFKEQGISEGVFSVLETEIPDKARIYARDLRALEELYRVLDSIAAAEQLLGTGSVTLESYINLLEYAMNFKNIEIQKGNHKGVMVLTPSAARGLKFKGVFCLGLSEGNFPRPPKKHMLYNEEEALFLKSLGIKLDTREDIIDMERLFFNIVLCAAEDVLYLTYSDNREDDPALASSFINETLEQFLEKPPIQKYSVRDIMPSNLMGSNLQNFQDQRLYQFPVKYYEKSSGILENLEPIEQMFNEDYVFSASQLDTYARCPFKFYCSYVLGLEPLEREAEEFTALDKGSIYHDTLARTYKLNREKIKDYVIKGNVPAARLMECMYKDLERVLEENFSRVKEDAVDSRLWSIRFEDVLNKLKDFIAKDLSSLKDGEFYPWLFEEQFKFSLKKDGKTLAIGGKVDRIDVAQDGRCLVYDYKTSAYGVSSLKDIQKGLSFQIPLYLLACKDMGLIPLGGGYLVLKGYMVRGGIWSEQVSGRRSGTLKAQQWEALIQDIKQYIFDYSNKMLQGYFPPEPRGGCDPFCQYKNICRNSR